MCSDGEYSEGLKVLARVFDTSFGGIRLFIIVLGKVPYLFPSNLTHITLRGANFSSERPFGCFVSAGAFPSWHFDFIEIIKSYYALCCVSDGK